MARPLHHILRLVDEQWYTFGLPERGLTTEPKFRLIETSA